ncbi:glycosyltransferase family 2 protein [Desulfotomaculum sp. 1211_IL3151]|uniref:glycosyltransferase family 2 protein n=1 Tax=Desulfotomaculum sp. 1211_IL3151 TaxID=3084055 RepID=UPI002FD91E28
MSGKTVSLCLIVKNERERLLNCINSARQIVNEVVVVDTGSTDDTVGIARAAGARVFSYAWQGNFSDARNYALEQATGQWILVLDADEVLAPLDVNYFNKLLAADQVEGYFVSIQSYQGDGGEIMTDNVVRLFKNNPLYRFSGAIHEQVAPSILKETAGKGLRACSLLINHFGYLDIEIKKKEKFKRNTFIIIKELEKSPADPFLLYSLALEYFQRGLIAEGVKCLEKALPQMNGSEGYYQDVIVATANGLLNLGQLDPLFRFLEEFLKVFPNHQQLLICRGLGQLQAQQYAQATEDLVRSLGEDEGKFLPRHQHLCLVGDVLMSLGHVDKAVELYLASLKHESGYIYPLIKIVDLLGCAYPLIDEKLSRVMSVNRLDRLWRQLLKEQKPSYAIVIIFLEIGLLLKKPDPEFMPSQLVLELYQFVHFEPFLKRASFNYLCVSVRQLYYYSLMLEKGYADFPINDRVSKLMKELMILFVKDYCPRAAAKGLNVLGWSALGGAGAEKESIDR